MSTNDPRFDRVARTWLAEGPVELADRVLDAALAEIHGTRQRRLVGAFRRDQFVTRLDATLAAVLVVAVAAVLVGLPRDEGVGGPAAGTPSPSPQQATPAPEPSSAAATVTIDRSAEDGYVMTVPSSWNYRSYPKGIFFSADAPITTAAMWVGELQGQPEAGYLIDVGDAYGGSPFNITGHTVDELLASVNSVYLSLQGSEGTAERQVTIDGEPGWVTEHAVSGPPVLWIDAVVIHGDRAFNLTMVAPHESADELRATFDEVMASIRWTD